VNGPLKITKSGTYSGLDVHGFVYVEAPNVIIRNSIIRGGTATNSIGLINDVTGKGTNLLVEDSELVPEHPSYYIDGITGWSYTARRVNIHGTVDGAKIFGNDTVIQDSWIHSLGYFAHDPMQNNGPSHNDAVQVLGGRNLLIEHNTLEGGANSALQVTQSHSAVSNLRLTDNWAGGGACTVNLQDAPLTSMSGIRVDHNRFLKTSTYKCAIIAYEGVSFVNEANTWSGTTTPVTVVRRA
jgi:hypothetical protein